MYYNLVKRQGKGGGQFNRVYLPYNLSLRGGWTSTRLLAESGKVPKTLSDDFAYICEYEPEDWIDEELSLGVTGNRSYRLRESYV